MRRLHVRRLGRVEYDDGLAMMRALVAARAAGVIPDTLALLEHPPVLTLGRAAAAGDHILLPREELAARGVEVFETDRGGDVTFHGPGQIVGYPIFDLNGGREDVRAYVRNIEESLLRCLAGYGIQADRAEGMPGVWVGNNKVGAIGVHINRWITSHGFALNVTTDLSYFSMIVPCGLPGRGVTSMSRLLSRRVEPAEVEERLIEEISQVFDAEPEERPVDKDSVSVYVWRHGNAGPEVLLLHRIPDRGAFWQPVTGAVEPGETPEAAAARELREETGCTATPAPIPYVHAFVWPRTDAPEPPRFLREHAFCVHVDEDWSPRIDATEHDDWRWSSIEGAVPEVPHTGLKRGLRLLSTRLESL